MYCTVESTINTLASMDIIVAEQPHQNNACACSESARIIGINPNKLKTQADRRTALLHEAGHFKSGAFYNKDAAFQPMEQAEYKAWKSAILDNVSREDLEECFSNGITELWELAEEFNVNEDFILKAILYYRERDMEAV